VVDVFLNTKALPPEQRKPAETEAAKSTLATIFKVLEGALKGRPYLLGARFSAADVMVGSVLIWARSLGLLEGHDELAAYCARLVDRPAYKRSLA
jgi:glutathione S-transferase